MRKDQGRVPILWIRGEAVILDADLARLYGVDTRALNRAVRRNAKRFPSDFVFLLKGEEVAILKCQIGTSSLGWGGSFAEDGRSDMGYGGVVNVKVNGNAVWWKD